KVTRATTAGKLPSVDWSRLLRPVLFTVIGGIIFYIPVSMLSFKIDDLGTTNTGIIGAVSAMAAVATAVGAGTFHRILGRSPNILAPLAFGLMGAGLLGLGLAQNVPEAAVAAVVANLGGGFIIPTLQNWSVQSVEYDQRGRASGAFSSALFVGQFIGPVVILGAIGRSHLSWSMGIAGVVGVVMVAVAAIAATAGHLRSNEEVEAAA
ncbi:MFS transporter, partial [Streptomyces sp. NPDC101455]|uniref:MFS transporter n=1 Tax=Streptomyces sp. NPDC101455 TaxID=3366142 RepID=UPI00382F757A